MNHTKPLLELAIAELSVALQHLDHDAEVSYQHVQRASKELKAVEYELWHKFHTSGVPYKVEVKS